MARIYKYEIKAEHRQLIQIPKGAEILYVALQHDLPQMWALVDPEAPVETRVFSLVTTGEVFNEEGAEYVGSFQAEGWFVGHVFETPVKGGGARPIQDRFKNDFKAVKHQLNGGEVEDA